MSRKEKGLTAAGKIYIDGLKDACNCWRNLSAIGVKV